MSCHKMIYACLAVAYSLTTHESQAASPANDSFANRQVLSGSLPIAVGGTTVEATQEADEPIYRAEGDSVWYQWTAPTTGLFKVTMSAVSPDEAPLVGILIGSTLDKLELLAPDGGNSVAQWQATAGQVYYIHVAAGENYANGAFSLTLSAGAAVGAPTNDSFSAAATIPATPPQIVNGSTLAATLESREPRPDSDFEDSDQRSVWYNWTPTTGGWTKIVTTGFEQVNVYTGAAVSSLTQVAISAYGDVRFNATASTTYRIQVLTTYEEDAGTFSLNLTRPTTAAPANNGFSAKTNLGTSNSVNRNDTTVGATVETGEKLPLDTRATVWYTWTAPSTGPFTIEVSSAEIYPSTAVYTGTTIANLVMRAVGQTNYDTDAHLLVFKATSGQVYQFQVGGDGWEEGAFNFKLRVSTLADVEDHQLMTGFSVTPGAVTVNGAGGTVTAEAKLSVQDPGFGFIMADSLAPWRHSGSGTPNRDIYSSEIQASLQFVDSTTTGNLTEHRFSKEITLPPWLPSGTYSFHFYPGSGGTTSFGNSKYDSPIPGGGSFTINNTTPADPLPNLTSFTASPTSVNVTSSSQTVDLQAVATDNLAVHAVTISAHTATGVHGGYVTFGSSGTTGLELSSGTKTNGTWTGTATVPRYLRPGIYYFSPTVEDATTAEEGAAVRFGKDYGFINPLGQALPGGSTASFTVINNGLVDIMPPQWLSTDFEPSTVDVRAGPQLVRMRVRLRDALSGVAQAYGNLSMNSGTEYVSFFNLASLYSGSSPISGDIHDGVWETFFVVNSTIPSGVADLFGAFQDMNGNFGDIFDGGPGPIGAKQEQLTIVSGGPNNPAETSWSATNFPGFFPYGPATALNADYDNDSLPNAVEFHLGTDPTDPTNAAQLSAVPVSSIAANKLRLQFGKSQTNPTLGDGAVTKIVGQSSPDLINWTEVTPVPLGGGMFAVEATPVAGKAYLRLAVVPIP